MKIKMKVKNFQKMLKKITCVLLSFSILFFSSPNSALDVLAETTTDADALAAPKNTETEVVTTENTSNLDQGIESFLPDTALMGSPASPASSKEMKLSDASNVSNPFSETIQTSLGSDSSLNHKVSNGTLKNSQDQDASYKKGELIVKLKVS